MKNKCKLCNERESICKDLCGRCYTREWRKNNSEKVKLNNKKRYQDNKEKYEEWRKNNPERIKELNRINYERKKEERKQYQRDYKKKNPEKVRKSQRNYVENNEERLKIKSRKNHDEKHFNGLRKATLERDGYKCVKCGVTQGQHIAVHGCSLIVHHIDGNGRYSSNPNSVESNLQTLCKRCHSSIHGKVKKERTP